MHCLLTCMLWLPVGIFLGYTFCHFINIAKTDTKDVLSHLETDVSSLHVKMDKLIGSVSVK